MQAILYCFYDIFDGKVHKGEEVFVMPAKAEDLMHLSVSFASQDAPISKALCHAISNRKRFFTFHDNIYTIINYKVFNWHYLDEYKEAPVVDLTILDKIVTIYVFEGKTSCSLRKHKVQDIHAIVLNASKTYSPSPASDTPVIVNAFHCPTCDKYWMSKSTLEGYQIQHIFPVARFRYVGEFNDYGLREVSDLRLYGYKASVPRPIRQNLLRWLIESGLFSRREIIEHINFCLKIPWNQPGREWARIEGYADRRFVEDLPIHTNLSVKGIVKPLR